MSEKLARWPRDASVSSPRAGRGAASSIILHPVVLLLTMRPLVLPTAVPPLGGMYRRAAGKARNRVSASTRDERNTISEAHLLRCRDQRLPFNLVAETLQEVWVEFGLDDLDARAVFEV